MDRLHRGGDGTDDVSFIFPSDRERKWTSCMARRTKDVTSEGMEHGSDVVAHVV